MKEMTFICPPHFGHLRASISQTFFRSSAYCCLLRLEYAERSFIETASSSAGTIGEMPGGFDLFNAGSNPGHGNVLLGVEIPETAVLEINLFDISGRNVKTVFDGVMSPGFYEIQVVNLVPGIYFCRIESDDFLDVEKLMIIE